jgi:hypothetical protein
MIEVGVAMAGEGGYDAPGDRKASSVVVDFITPETETSHHYFWGMARRFQVQDAALTDRIREGQGKIFGEDLAMLEQQQRNLSTYPDRRLLLLNIDAGGARSRQMIEKAIAAERVVEGCEGGERCLRRAKGGGPLRSLSCRGGCLVCGVVFRGEGVFGRFAGDLMCGWTFGTTRTASGSMNTQST